MTVSGSAKANDLYDSIRGATERLSSEFAGYFSSELIEKYASESFETLKDAPIPDFVPLFVERSTRERLREALAANGPRA